MEEVHAWSPRGISRDSMRQIDAACAQLHHATVDDKAEDDSVLWWIDVHLCTLISQLPKTKKQIVAFVEARGQYEDYPRVRHLSGDDILHLDTGMLAMGISGILMKQGFTLRHAADETASLLTDITHNYDTIDKYRVLFVIAFGDNPYVKIHKGDDVEFVDDNGHEWRGTIAAARDEWCLVKLPNGVLKRRRCSEVDRKCNMFAGIHLL